MSAQKRAKKSAVDNGADATRIVDALSREESPLRDAGVAMITEFLLDRRVAELIDVEAIVTVTVASFAESNVKRIVDEHLSPMWDRHRERSEEAKETPGGALPDHVQRKLLDIAARSKVPRGEWMKGAVDPALLRELFAPVLTDTLISFAQKLPLAVTGRGGEREEEPGRPAGALDRLRRGAQKRAGQLASVGKSALGSLDLDKRMAEAAKEFSKGAGRELGEAMRARLGSERGRELATEIRRQLFTRFLETEIAVLMREVETLPRAELEALVGPVAAHNGERAFFRDAFETELRAALDVEGKKTIRSLADELGVLDEARSAIRRTVDPLARELFGSRAFSSWLADVLAS